MPPRSIKPLDRVGRLPRPAGSPSAARFDRRHLLARTAGSFVGLNLPLLGRLVGRSERHAPRLRAGEAADGGRSPIRACILIFYYGGPSHLDTWDPKPRAPAEIRGEFQPIATSVPGVTISEHLPRMARLMHHVALVRSVHHPMRNHNSAAVEALCGRTPLGGDLELLADTALSFPCYGSALRYAQPTAADLAHVALPHVMYNIVPLPGQTAGFLGPAYDPFRIEADPNAADFRVESLELRAGLSAERLDARQALAARLAERRTTPGTSAAAAGPAAGAAIDAYYEQAFDLLRSPTVRESLRIEREDEATRERYGRNGHGQSVLLARRLVEAGVRFVTVFDKVHNGQDANWDSHAEVFVRHRDHLLPPADLALSALVDDLAARGLLDSTLVVALGEFGRTPRINGAAGRDHWPDCFSVVLAGGGVQGGAVWGASDASGAYPARDPVGTGDLAATLFWRFGVDPATEIRDFTGRPFRLAEGAPLARLFG